MGAAAGTVGENEALPVRSFGSVEESNDMWIDGAVGEFADEVGQGMILTRVHVGRGERSRGFSASLKPNRNESWIDHRGCHFGQTDVPSVLRCLSEAIQFQRISTEKKIPVDASDAVNGLFRELHNVVQQDKGAPCHKI